jgi:hypothetical protein
MPGMCVNMFHGTCIARSRSLPNSFSFASEGIQLSSLGVDTINQSLDAGCRRRIMLWMHPSRSWPWLTGFIQIQPSPFDLQPPTSFYYIFLQHSFTLDIPQITQPLPHRRRQEASTGHRLVGLEANGLERDCWKKVMAVFTGMLGVAQRAVLS